MVNDVQVASWRNNSTRLSSQVNSRNSQGASGRLGRNIEKNSVINELIVQHAPDEFGIISRSNLSIALTESIKSVTCVAVSSVTLSSNQNRIGSSASHRNISSSEQHNSRSDHFSRGSHISSSSSSDSTIIRTSINVHVLCKYLFLPSSCRVLRTFIHLTTLRNNSPSGFSSWSFLFLPLIIIGKRNRVLRSSYVRTPVRSKELEENKRGIDCVTDLGHTHTIQDQLFNEGF